MKHGLKWFGAVLLGAMLVQSAARADTGKEAPNGPVLTAMLHAFLAGASRNDPAVHDRFWSERLVYTSSTGARFGKAEIMESLGEAGTFVRKGGIWKAVAWQATRIAAGDSAG